VVDVTYSAIDPKASLRGKTAFVTGAGSGFGRVIAEAFDELGLFVLAVDTDERAIRELAIDAVSITEAIPMDVSDRSQMRAFADAWAAEPIHVLVNAAGSAVPAAFAAPDFEAHWDDTLRRNLTGAQNAVQALLPALLAGGASVVNVCSVQSFVHLGTSVAYSAAEGGLAQFTRALAAELGGKGVRVNAVAPGAIRLDDGTAGPAAETIVSRTPGGREGRAEDMIGPVLFLASAMSRHVNGVVLPVDGGFLTR